MHNIIFYCQDITTRTQVLEQLFDLPIPNEEQVPNCLIRRHGQGFSLQCFISDAMHKQIINRVFHVTYEIIQ